MLPTREASQLANIEDVPGFYVGRDMRILIKTATLQLPILRF
jgi:hypothetical protein